MMGWETLYFCSLGEIQIFRWDQSHRLNTAEAKWVRLHTFSLPKRGGEMRFSMALLALLVGFLLAGKAVGQEEEGSGEAAEGSGMNCIKIGLPGKMILSERKGLREVLFS